MIDVPFDAITVHHGDTSHLPYGMGTWGCRFGVAAAAVHAAATEVRANVLKASAAVLEVAEEDLRLKDGRVYVAGMPERGCSLRELSRAVSPLAPVPFLSVIRFFQLPSMSKFHAWPGVYVVGL